MQGTTAFHHGIAHAVLPQPDPVFDNAAALAAMVDTLEAQPTVRQGLIGHLLCQGACLAAGWLGRHADRDVGQRERQEAEVLSQPTPGGQGIRRRVGHGFVMDATARGVAEQEDREQGIDQQDIFTCVYPDLWDTMPPR
jgi:hypothetical protein